MPIEKFVKLLEDFEHEIQDAYNLVKISNTVKNAHSKPNLHQNDVNRIAELSFLKICISWERFLQESFVAHMLHKKPSSKFHSYLKPRNRDHIATILKEGRPYPDFLNIEFVLRISDMYLRRGRPYRDVINIFRSRIGYMKTIRNVIVHMSDKSEKDFKALVRSELGTCPRALTPGSFLLTMKNKRQSYLIYYGESLKLASKRIVQ